MRHYFNKTKISAITLACLHALYFSTAQAQRIEDTPPFLPSFSDIALYSPQKPLSARTQGSNNTINLDSETLYNPVFGGRSASGYGDASNNTLNISSSTSTYLPESSGGYTLHGNANNNTVNLNNSNFNQVSDFTGGYSAYGTANNNTFNINNTEVVFAKSGLSTSGDAHYNTMNITGDSTIIWQAAFGGLSSTGNAHYNTVNMDSGGAKALVGGSSGRGSANHNTVNISGGEILVHGMPGSITGGLSMTGEGDAIHNTVNISGNPNLQGAMIQGGTRSTINGWGDLRTGNTLNIRGFTGEVNLIGNFENYNFYLPSSIQAGDTVLSVYHSMEMNNTNIGVGIEGGSAPYLGLGGEITLIDITGGTLEANNYKVKPLEGILLNYDLSVHTNSNKLVARVTRVSTTTQSKALAEGSMAGLTSITQGADLVADSGLSNAIAAATVSGGGLSSFGAMSGSSIKYKTGSHVDANGFSLLAGASWKLDVAGKPLVLGGFIEGGWGNYDSYNNFNNFAVVKGKGDTKHYGVGMLAQISLTEQLYIDGSFRVGQVETDFKSMNMALANGLAEYDSKSSYYSLHAGLGYKWTFNEQLTLDLSTKYLWTHQGSDSVSILFTPVNFESKNSHRWRNGINATYRMNQQFSLLAGAAFEYEFDSKARSTVQGHKVDSPTLKGGTGILELGARYKPVASSPLSFDFKLQGLFGKKEGVTGQLQLNYSF